MPIIKEDGLLHQREIEEMDGTIVHMKVECSKDQLPLLEAVKTRNTGNRAPSRQQARSSESSRVISQQGNEHSLPQDSRTESTRFHKTDSSQQQTDTAFHKESRIIKKSHRLQKDQEINKKKAVPKQNQSV
jgi:hypothetical protein